MIDKMRWMTALIIVLIIGLGGCESSQTIEMTEQLELGMMVKEVTLALDSPADATSMEVIVRYGTDSRYYTMIRGWIVQELKGVESQLMGQQETTSSEKRHKLLFLRQALRRIDLE